MDRLIQQTFKVDDVLTDVTTAKLSAPDGSYGIKRNDTDVTVVADGTDMTKPAGTTGTYTYTLEDAVESVSYTAYIEFVYDSDTFHIEYDLPAWVSSADLDLVYTNLKTEIADYLGWTRSSGNWSSDEVARLDAVLNAGYRQFIYPPVAPGETVSYRWSFLRPTATFDTVASTYLYDMPVAFGYIVGDLSYDEDEDIPRIIEQTNPGMIDRERAANDYEGRPYLFALRSKSTAQTAEQTTELMLYPTPDAAYGIVYHYDAKVDVLSDTYPYPLGGQAHSETILQSCRDIAASRYKDDTGGREHQMFLERLKASIESDRRNSPKKVGVNNDGREVVYTRHGTEFSVSMTGNLGP